MAERTYLGGFTSTVLHAEADGTLIVEERQDCQAIVDSNQRKRDHRFSSMSPDGTVQEAFDIPMVEVLRWQRECGAQMFSDEHMAYMDKMLKSPEYKYLGAAPTVRDPRVIIKGAR